MDIRICVQHCPKLKNKDCNMVIYDLAVDNPAETCDRRFIPVIADKDSYYGKWLCQMKPIPISSYLYNDKVIGVVDLKVYEDCPFYTEHTLHDLNNDGGK